MQNCMLAKLYVLHTSLERHLPHRLCLCSFLTLSNVYRFLNHIRYRNINGSTLDKPTGLFTNN